MPAIRKSIALVILTLVLALTCVAFAGAEPVAKALKIDVGIVGGTKTAPFFNSATWMPEDTPLPVQVPVAVPADAEILWVGEVSDAQSSELATATYTFLETREDHDIYLVDLTQYRVAKVETTYGGAHLRPAADGSGIALFSYTPAIDVDMLTMGVEAPFGSTMENQVNYAFLGTGASEGTNVYGTTFAPAIAGETYSMQYTYSAITAQQGATDSFMTVIIVLAVILVAVVVVLFAIMQRQRGGGGSTSQSDTVSASGKSTTKAAPKKQSHGPKHSHHKKGFSFNSPQGVMVVVVVVILVAAVVMATYSFQNNITFNNGVYSQQIGGGDDCSEITFNLSETAIADPEAAAQNLFKTLRESNLVLHSVFLDTNLNTFIVKYCASQENDVAIASVVEATGYVTNAAQSIDSILADPVLPNVETKDQ